MEDLVEGVGSVVAVEEERSEDVSLSQSVTASIGRSSSRTEQQERVSILGSTGRETGIFSAGTATDSWRWQVV
jgi:hypothetical protein